jgi:hypothetical protein
MAIMAFTNGNQARSSRSVHLHHIHNTWCQARLLKQSHYTAHPALDESGMLIKLAVIQLQILQ